MYVSGNHRMWAWEGRSNMSPLNPCGCSYLNMIDIFMSCAYVCIAIDSYLKHYIFGEKNVALHINKMVTYTYILAMRISWHFILIDYVIIWDGKLLEHPVFAGMVLALWLSIHSWRKWLNGWLKPQEWRGTFFGFPTL